VVFIVDDDDVLDLPQRLVALADAAILSECGTRPECNGGQDK
jgi:hypothetical protein